jgi:hypothetical protein
MMNMLGSRGLICCLNGGVANFPLLSEEGWLRDQKSREASLARTDGVVSKYQPNSDGI